MSAALDFTKWRDGEVHRVGRKMQMQAEALEEKHQSTPRVEVYESESGVKRTHRRHIAQILQRKGEVCAVKGTRSTVCAPNYRPGQFESIFGRAS